MDISIVFGILGTITTIAMFSAPAKHFRLIVKQGSVGEWSVLPYIVGFSQCLLWFVYDVYVDFVLHACSNAAGMAMQMTFCIIFIRYAGKQRLSVIWWLVASVTISSLLCLVVLLTAHSWSFIAGPPDERARAVLGGICVFVCISMYAAPLDVSRKVILRRVAVEECMPWFYSLNIVINLAMWISYGVIKQDMNIAIPASIGLLLGVMQLVLFVCYRNCPPKVEAGDPHNVASSGQASNSELVTI